MKYVILFIVFLIHLRYEYLFFINLFYLLISTYILINYLQIINIIYITIIIYILDVLINSTQVINTLSIFISLLFFLNRFLDIKCYYNYLSNIFIFIIFSLLIHINKILLLYIINNDLIKFNFNFILSVIICSIINGIYNGIFIEKIN